MKLNPTSEFERALALAIRKDVGELTGLLRSGYNFTPQERDRLAQFIEGKLKRRAGRPLKDPTEIGNIFDRSKMPAPATYRDRKRRPRKPWQNK